MSKLVTHPTSTADQQVNAANDHANAMPSLSADKLLQHLIWGCLACASFPTTAKCCQPTTPTPRLSFVVHDGHMTDVWVSNLISHLNDLMRHDDRFHPLPVCWLPYIHRYAGSVYFKIPHDLASQSAQACNGKFLPADRRTQCSYNPFVLCSASCFCPNNESIQILLVMQNKLLAHA